MRGCTSSHETKGKCESTLNRKQRQPKKTPKGLGSKDAIRYNNAYKRDTRASDADTRA